MGVNKQFINDYKKAVSADKGANQTLSPGTVSRRWTPSGGLGKHNEKIHRESRHTDRHKNLPFSFSKPNKPKGQSVYVKCNNCGYIISATTVTVGIICPSCKKFSTVIKVEAEVEM
jgi:predicted Zn-ribbon and HTH transcriptional regulator